MTETRNRKLTPEQRAEIVNEAKAGATHVMLADKYKVSRQAISMICIRAGHRTKRERGTATTTMDEQPQDAA